MLYDKEKIGLGCKKILYACFPINKANNIIEFFKVSHNIFYHYIIGKLIDSLIIGCLAFIGFQFILKINNALFLSFIIFLTNIIPYCYDLGLQPNKIIMGSFIFTYTPTIRWKLNWT